MTLAVIRDVVYGPHERNRLDVFTPAGAPPPHGWPTLVFIHGGYWQRLYGTTGA